MARFDCAGLTNGLSLFASHAISSSPCRRLLVNDWAARASLSRGPIFGSTLAGESRDREELSSTADLMWGAIILIVAVLLSV